jgi:proteic killer suppression protein
MIRSFRHKGLESLYERGDRRRLPPALADKLERILARLDVATAADDMNLPGYRLHRLRGNLAGFWAVMASANWRVVFRLEDGNALDVDLVDYH